MLVREAMTTDVVSVGPDTSIKTAAQLLHHHQVTTLPVLDERGELLGVVGEADVLVDAFLPDQRAHEKPVAPARPPAFTKVGQVMSRHVLTVPADADVAQAADLMLGTVVKSLPVIAENRVVGILSRRDLVALLAERDEQIEADVDHLIAGAGYDWTVEVHDGVVTVSGPASAGDIEIASVLIGTVPGVIGLYVEGASTAT